MLQLFYVHVSMVSNVKFILSLFVPRLSVFWRLRKAVLRYYGIFLVSSLIFYSDVG